MFQKELYNDIPNITVRQVLRKHLYLKMYKLSIVQHLKPVFPNLESADPGGSASKSKGVREIVYFN
jgi:hypothetical protein